MRTNFLIRKYTFELLRIAVEIFFPQINEDLTYLGSAKEMLLGRLEQRRQRRLFVNEEAGEAVVEEALVTERIAVSIDNENMLRDLLIQMIGGEVI